MNVCIERQINFSYLEYYSVNWYLVNDFENGEQIAQYKIPSHNLENDVHMFGMLVNSLAMIVVLFQQ